MGQIRTFVEMELEDLGRPHALCHCGPGYDPLGLVGGSTFAVSQSSGSATSDGMAFLKPYRFLEQV